MRGYRWVTGYPDDGTIGNAPSGSRSFGCDARLPRVWRAPRHGCRMRQMTLDVYAPHTADIAGNFEFSMGFVQRRKRCAQRPHHGWRCDPCPSAEATLRKPTIDTIGYPLSEPMASQCERVGVRRYREPRAARPFERSPTNRLP